MSWWLMLIDRMGASMQLPGAAAWVPQTPTQLTPAATPNSAMPQAIAYPTMQQFQVSPQVNSLLFSLDFLFDSQAVSSSSLIFFKFIVFHLMHSCWPTVGWRRMDHRTSRSFGLNIKKAKWRCKKRNCTASEQKSGGRNVYVCNLINSWILNKMHEIKLGIFESSMKR